MKRNIFSVFLLCGFQIAVIAQRIVGLGSPWDDPSARQAANERVELKPFVADYTQIVDMYLRPLKAEDRAKIFGFKLAQRRLMMENDPTNSVAPLFAGATILFSGLLEGKDKSHRDLYAVGDVGFVEFFYERDDRFKTAVLYSRLDDKFVPLRSANDISKRLEWDKVKCTAIKKWLNTHIIPAKDAKQIPDAAAKPTN